MKCILRFLKNELIQNVKDACDTFDGDVIAIICNETSKYRVGKITLKPLFDKIRFSADDFEFENATEAADYAAKK